MRTPTSRETALSTDGLRRAKVLGVDERGAITVTVSDETGAFAADCVRTSDASPLRLVPGDDVLVWVPPDRARAVVVGRIESASETAPRVPDELVLEAKKGLVLRVGEGSITIRADGKILIKGKDLVSHAKRMNRIKGGAVSLN
jgi:hypothetical protein